MTGNYDWREQVTTTLKLCGRDENLTGKRSPEEISLTQDDRRKALQNDLVKNEGSKLGRTRCEMTNINSYLVVLVVTEFWDDMTAVFVDLLSGVSLLYYVA